MKFLVWGLVLAVIFTTAAAATYSLSHKTPVVAIAVPTPMPVVATVAPTAIPTPDELAASSTNPFDADSDYENPFDDSSYQNPF